MDRNSTLYRFRRRCQVLAHKIISDEMLSKAYFRIVMGKKLDIKNPKTFNEKIQWCKLYYYPKNKEVVTCSDKYAVREYMENKGYGNTLVPLIGAWDNPENIEWDTLPDKFVLKCNHGCAYNIVCNDKSQLDKAATVRQLKTWMSEDFGAFNIELHYSEVKPRMITCEEFLGANITDYKFFCFNGVPKYIYVSKNMIHDREAEIGFFNLDGTKMLLKRDDYADIENVSFPPFFADMLEMARNLCKGFPFVRVDFFLANDRYYFAELTFTPSAGMMPFNPEKIDREWGDMLDISGVR